ncbi:MAG: S8 family peptidase [Rhizobacter sp.]
MMEILRGQVQPGEPADGFNVDGEDFIEKVRETDRHRQQLRATPYEELRRTWSSPFLSTEEYSPAKAVGAFGNSAVADIAASKERTQLLNNPALAFLKQQHAAGNTGKGVVVILDEGPGDHRRATAGILKTMLPDAKVLMVGANYSDLLAKPASRFNQLTVQLIDNPGRGGLDNASLRDRTKAALMAMLSDTEEVINTAVQNGAQYISRSWTQKYDAMATRPNNPEARERVQKELNAVVGSGSNYEQYAAWIRYVDNLASSDPEIKSKLDDIQQLLRKNKIIYAEGAGNENDKPMPREVQGLVLSRLLPNVMTTVGATDPKTGAVANYSSYNRSTDIREQPAVSEGTSFSTPSAVAQIALLVGASGKTITPQQALALLESTANASKNTNVLRDGVGDMDFNAALAKLKKGATLPTDGSTDRSTAATKPNTTSALGGMNGVPLALRNLPVRDMLTY